MVEYTLWERGVAGSSPVSPIGEHMVDEFNIFKLFNFNNSWILTKEKIASSWLVEQVEGWCEVYIHNHTHEIKLVNFESAHTNFSEEKYYECLNKFAHSWNLFIQGNKADDNFIILIRNPIQKFVSGWVQDNIMTKVTKEFIERENIRLLEYFDDYLVDRFIEFLNKQVTTTGSTFPDVSSLPFKFKDIYEEFCFPRNQIFFKRNVKTVLDCTLYGHPSQDLFIVWNLLFKKQSLNKDSLHIIDIDLEDLSSALENKFNIKLKEGNTFRNKRSEYLINKAYAYLSEHYTTINQLLSLQIFLWFEIVSRIYKDTPHDDYKKKYFIDDTFDFFDIQTHLNWWKYIPTKISLTYTLK